MSKGNPYRRKSPVAKFMNAISRPQTHRSKKDYRRQPKFRRDFLEY